MNHAGSSGRIGRVAIVGSGQVGTMLGMALRRAPVQAGIDEVALYDRDPSATAASLARQAGHRIVSEHDVFEANAIILALPLPEILLWLQVNAERIKPGSLLIDTGSAKQKVTEAMVRFAPETIHAVGGHPMAGTEVRGPAGARVELLRGAPFILTPVREDREAMLRARSLVVAVGARAVEMEAETHDRVVARTSHLPHAIAYALCVVASRAFDGVLVRDLAAGGFESATRLARSDPRMVAGFLTSNAGEVRRAAEELKEELDVLLRKLEGEPEDLAGTLAEARAAWDLPA